MTRFKFSLALLALLFVGPLRAASPDTRIVLMEDFEGYTNTAALRSVWSGGSAELETNAPGGGHAASHDGGGMNALNGFSVRPDASHSVLFSADFFDPGTNDNKRVTIILKNPNGDSLEFGCVRKSMPYAMRITGFATPTDWIPFDPAFRSERGWHRFQAIISITNTVVTLDLNRDGDIDMALVFDGPAPEKPFKTIRFGGLSDRQSPGGPVLVKNIELALIPSDGPIPAIAVHPPAIVPIAYQPSARPRAPDLIMVPTISAPEHNMALWGIVGALTVIIGLLGALILTLRRGHRAGAASWAMTTVPPPGPMVGPLSQNPAVTAELAEFAKQSLVQGLYSQRMALIEAQQRAQTDLAELEARLTGLQVPLQERIHTYEKRIAELEKQLETKGEEMRELTQMTLRLMRGKLEEEKERQRIEGGRFN